MFLIFLHKTNRKIVGVDVYVDVLLIDQLQLGERLGCGGRGEENDYKVIEEKCFSMLQATVLYDLIQLNRQ
jgi:hypothetical protein